MNTRNTLIISIASTVAFVALVMGICIGNVMTSQATARVDIDSNKSLVDCAQTTARSAADCRALIYGNR